MISQIAENTIATILNASGITQESSILSSSILAKLQESVRIGGPGGGVVVLEEVMEGVVKEMMNNNEERRRKSTCCL